MLLIFQAMGAAGKDGTIKHVMSGVNPQGCQVYSFKAPLPRDHDYMWRCMKSLPNRGHIGIFIKTDSQRAHFILRPIRTRGPHPPALVAVTI